MSALTEAQLSFVRKWNAIIEHWRPIRPELADWEHIPEEIFETIPAESLTSMSGSELRESVGSTGAHSPFWSAS